MDESCCAVFHDAVGGCDLKELSLFLFIGSHSDLFQCIRHSAMKVLHCSIPMVSICCKLVTAVGPELSDLDIPPLKYSLDLKLLLQGI